MRVAVCDDQASCREQMIALIRQGEPEQLQVDGFGTGEALLQDMARQPYDLIFLDIEMGHGMSGLETASRIRQQNKTVMLVFVTAHASFVFDAFDVQAMQYLLKPIDEAQFQRVFQRCRRKFYDEEYRLSFRVCNQRGQEEIVLLMVKEILYVESFLRKLQVHTVTGENIEIVEKISVMETLLENRGFLRVHKSYLVNMAYLRRIETEQVMLQAGAEPPTRLPLARRKREQVKQAFLQYKVEDTMDS